MSTDSSVSTSVDSPASVAVSIVAKPLKRPYKDLNAFQLKFETEFYKTMRLLLEEYTDTMIRGALVAPIPRDESNRSIVNQFLARKQGDDPEKYFFNLRIFIDLLKIKGRSKELWEPMEDGRSLFGELCLYEKKEYGYYKDPEAYDERYPPPDEPDVSDYDVMYTEMLCEIIDLIPYSVLNGGMLGVPSKVFVKHEGRTPVQNIVSSIVYHELLFERLKHFDGFKQTASHE